mgnify:CR=1 FL=1
MQLRGAATNKLWKQRRRERAQADVVELRERQVIVEGIQHNVSLTVTHAGVNICTIQTAALYFENGQRVATVHTTGNDALDWLLGRLLRAFFNIEARYT